MADFQVWKKNALTKNDKSSIGEIDPRIRKLCDKINSRKDMFTLSSCSGRISLLENFNYKKVRKVWCLVTHDKAKFSEFWEILDSYNTDLKTSKLEFRQESAILHICTLNLELAQKLMHVAKESGFNTCGVIALKNKIVVELICDIMISAPIYDNELLVTKPYMTYLVKLANRNLSKNWENIAKLEESLKKI